MAIYASISRLIAYLERHGLRATLARVAVSFKRLASTGQMALFYRDLRNDEAIECSLPSHLQVERKEDRREIGDEDWTRITEFWNPSVSRYEFANRLKNGASLWLIRSNGQLAGYGWTVVGRTVQPHYYLLGRNDVHLFDFLVMPEFRGHGINPALVRSIVEQLRSEGRTRAYIEAAEWNHSQLRSLSKTGFCQFGVARKVTLFGSTFVQWCGPQKPLQANDTMENN